MSTYIEPGSSTAGAVRDEARARARDTLSRSSAFAAMSVSDQRQIYADLVAENVDKLSRPGLLSGSASREPEVTRAMIESFGKYDPGFDKSVDAFEDLVDSVDFPKFVGDLLKSVFDANLNVSKRQTDDYIKLLREATKTTAEYLKKIDDEDAFAYLVESPQSQFGMTMEQGADGSSKMVLTTPEGEPVDMSDNAVKAKIIEAKINMAKEHRAALREVILMGVTRLVVEKGEVEAGVKFKITANRTSKKSNSNTNTNVNTVSASYGGGLSSLFGGPSISMQNVNTNINVRTSNQSAEDTLAAELMGHVKIQFKSDFFKLDNFKDMYADGGVAALKPPPNAPGIAPTSRA